LDKYRSSTGQKVAAVFLLGCALFNYPVLSIFSIDGLIFGIPILYCYLFFTWAVVIGLLAVILEQRK